MQTLPFIGMVVLGGGLGAVLGHFGKCASGTCPLTATPWRGAMFGAIVAALVAGPAGLGPPGAVAPQPAGAGAGGPHRSDPGQGHADAGPSSVVHVASEEQFTAEVLGGQRLWLVDFYATWCGVCRVLEPVIQEAARENKGRFRVAKIDVDKLPGLARRYKVDAIPHLSIIVGGEEVSKRVGALGKADLLKWVSSKLPAPTGPASDG